MLILSSNFLFNFNPSVNLFPGERKELKIIDCHYLILLHCFLQTITDPMTISQFENYYSDITVSFNSNIE